MNQEPISFDRAKGAMREGNPWPMLSERTQFPSENAKRQWQQKAAIMQELLDSVRGRYWSKGTADQVNQIFVSDSDTRNLPLAKRFLQNILVSCRSVSDEDYRNFLSEFVPAADVADAVVRSREHQNAVAAHIEKLINELQ